MGMIKISTLGSFPRCDREFDAQEGGHAQAVARAMQFLAEVVLPEAIVRDHTLHDEDRRPNNKDFAQQEEG